ncbi:MAG: hypothetical protein JOZ62_19435, partial [Acidobacteriaceae bacterium]|nr:hypothetical protein [Acidobacteriaceae bacterium]
MTAVIAAAGAGLEARRWPRKALTVAAAFACALLIPNAMLVGGGSYDDHTVFAYIGWLMHRGFAPYRDVWDHKGPLLYYLNWLGWAITPHSTVGIGILQAAVYLIAFAVLIRILAGTFGRLAVLLSLLFGVGFLARAGEGGNMVETWAVGAIALCHYIVFDASRRKPELWHFALITSSFVSCFWIRPNLCALPGIALLSLLVVVQLEIGYKSALRLLGFCTLVALVETGLVLYPIWRTGTEHDMWSAYFTYNADYTRVVNWKLRMYAILQLKGMIKVLPLAYAAVLGWFLLLRNVLKRAAPSIPISFVYAAFVTLSFPVEVLAYIISGRPYYHYWAPLAPTMTILSAVAFYSLFERVKLWKMPVRVAIAALIAAAVLYQARMYILVLRLDAPHDSEIRIARYVDGVTTSRDRILPVGDVVPSVAIALRARRLPASPYIFQLPMIHHANPQSSIQRASFIASVRRNLPAVIVSTPGIVG